MGSAGSTRASSPHASLLLVLDGLGDRPSPEFGGRSPVEAAATPNLDRWSREGEVGELSILGPGVAPESDAGVFALLGYDPVHDSPGRGVLEALGAELPLQPGDVALRLNFATLDGEGRVLDARVGRSLSTAQAGQLADAISKADLVADLGVRAVVRATVGHRGVLWLSALHGEALSPEISNADPFYERVGGLGKARAVAEPRVQAVRPLDSSAAAARTAQALNRFLERVGPTLREQPTNLARRREGRPEASGLLVRNAGTLPARAPPSFTERYGVAGAALTEMPVERGIARLLRLEDRFVGPMGPDRAAGYRERAERTLELLRERPFVYVHLKGPDEPGHDGDARRKSLVLEEIDRSFVGPLYERLDLSSVAVAVTADHATPCVLRAHSDDPVPWLLVGPGVPHADGGQSRRFASLPSAPPSLLREAGSVVPSLLKAAGLGRPA